MDRRCAPRKNSSRSSCPGFCTWAYVYSPIDLRNSSLSRVEISPMWAAASTCWVSGISSPHLGHSIAITFNLRDSGVCALTFDETHDRVADFAWLFNEFIPPFVRNFITKRFGHMILLVGIVLHKTVFIGRCWSTLEYRTVMMDDN